MHVLNCMRNTFALLDISPDKITASVLIKILMWDMEISQEKLPRGDRSMEKNILLTIRKRDTR